VSISPRSSPASVMRVAVVPSAVLPFARSTATEDRLLRVVAPFLWRATAPGTECWCEEVALLRITEPELQQRREKGKIDEFLAGRGSVREGERGKSAKTSYLE